MYDDALGISAFFVASSYLPLINCLSTYPTGWRSASQLATYVAVDGRVARYVASKLRTELYGAATLGLIDCATGLAQA
jgi:hypothetical protein